MGNQQSASNSKSYKAYVQSFVPPNGKIINSSTEVETMTNNIKNILEFHTNLNNTYKEFKPIIGSFIHKIVDGNVINGLVPQKEKENVRILLNFLFNLGIFKTKVKDNEHIVIVDHPNFGIIHDKFIENLTKLSAISPIQSTYSVNTVNEESIKKQFENNMKTINGVMARIMFYKYCIVYNNYLMHIYAIYAQSQFEIFESNVIKNKKQQEFSLIQKALDDTLTKTNTKYDVNLSNSLNSLNKKIVKGGATTNTENKQIMSNISNIQKALLANFEQFNNSNKNTAEFFKNVNEILDNKTRQIVAKYTELNINEVLNKNILNSLKTLETKILDNTITPSAENIEIMIGNLTTDENEKQLLRNYLQIISIQANANRLNNALKSQPQPPVVSNTEEVFVNAPTELSNNAPNPEVFVNAQTRPQSTITATATNTVNVINASVNTNNAKPVANANSMNANKKNGNTNGANVSKSTNGANTNGANANVANANVANAKPANVANAKPVNVVNANVDKNANKNANKVNTKTVNKP